MIPHETPSFTPANGEPCCKTNVENIAMDGEGTLTVALGGQIRYASASALQTRLQEQFCLYQPHVLLLNLEHVTFVDSQGLSFFIALYKLCYAQGCGLTLSHLQPPVLNLIRLTRIDAFVKIVASG